MSWRVWCQVTTSLVPTLETGGFDDACGADRGRATPAHAERCGPSPPRLVQTLDGPVIRIGYLSSYRPLTAPRMLLRSRPGWLKMLLCSRPVPRSAVLVQAHRASRGPSREDDFVSQNQSILDGAEAVFALEHALHCVDRNGHARQDTPRSGATDVDLPRRSPAVQAPRGARQSVTRKSSAVMRKPSNVIRKSSSATRSSPGVTQSSPGVTRSRRAWHGARQASRRSPTVIRKSSILTPSLSSVTRSSPWRHTKVVERHTELARRHTNRERASGGLTEVTRTR